MSNLFTVKTRSGSVYELDLPAQTFRQVSGEGAGAKYREATKYDLLIIASDPNFGLRFILPDGGSLHTSQIVEGHHDLFWENYHRALAEAGLPAEGAPETN